MEWFPVVRHHQGKADRVGHSVVATVPTSQWGWRRIMLLSEFGDGFPIVATYKMTIRHDSGMIGMRNEDDYY